MAKESQKWDCSWLGKWDEKKVFMRVKIACLYADSNSLVEREGWITEERGEIIRAIGLNR